MIRSNEHYAGLPGAYLFATVAARVRAHREQHPALPVISLGIGDVTRPLPPAVITALHTAVDEMASAASFKGYGPEQGYDFLREAIAAHDYRARGVQMDASDIFVSDGSKCDVANIQELFSLSCRVAVTDPVYPVYVDSNAMAGRAGRWTGDRWSDLIYLPCTEANDFVPDFPAAVPDIIYLCYPNNPTGTVLTPAELRLMADIAREHGLYLICDEVYREFTYDGEPLHSFGKFDYGQENLILIDSVSKRFSACGARIGCLISRNKDFMANALKYCQARLSVATLDQIAAAALYTVGPDYFEQVRQEYKRRRDTVVRKLHEIPGVICECPRGAFYLMAALPVDNAEKFQLWLLQEFEDHGDTVMFSAGEPFYATEGKGLNEIRIAYVLKQEDLERAMDLLALGIQKYNETH